MAEKSINSLIDEMVKELSPKVPTDPGGPKYSKYGPTGLPLTLWLTVEYKEKYDSLQELSKRKFGKFLKEVIKKSIDKVIEEKKLGA